MPAQDFRPRKAIHRGREVWQVRAPDLHMRLTEVDCGKWAGIDLGVNQAAEVVRRAAAKGFPLTTEDALMLSPVAEGEPRPLPLSEKAFARAVRWVNANGPAGYHLGMKLMDIWYMPDVWWTDTGGDEISAGDSGLDGDWGLADLDDEDRQAAIDLGRENDQISIYDVVNGTTIDTGGTGGIQDG